MTEKEKILLIWYVCVDENILLFQELMFLRKKE